MTDHGTIAETGDISRMSRSQDELAFAALLERHRRELHIHCYRMLASFDDAEDAVQDAFLRAWKYRDSRDEAVPVRPWLYRIATNACLDLVARERKATGEAEEITWLQPYPDALLEMVTKETIELAFLTVIQRLTPQQRATLILCDVLGWSAAEAAETLETTVASVNGALQRARATLRKHLPSRKAEDASDAERELVRKFMEASEKADVAWFATAVREDVVFRMPPEPGETVGREAMMQLWIEGGLGTTMQLQCVPTRANRQPAIAFYDHGEAMALDVFRIEEGMITEIMTFPPSVFEQFGLPSRIR